MAETSRYGRCTNKTQCSLAFNRESVLVPPDGNCPECSRPLKVTGMFARLFRWFMILVFLGALGYGGWWAKKKYIDSGTIDLGKLTSLGTPSKDAGPTPSPGSNNNGNPPDASPAATAGPVTKPDYEITGTNAQARKDVLKRIDVMPHLSEAQRAKLTDAVDRARNMGCIFIIPFKDGQRSLDTKETDILVNGFKTAGIQQLLTDPTVVFVVLGYSDVAGNTSTNEKISLDRAESVLNAMKARCGVQNVTYSVGMGASNMYDGKGTAKNRLVEIWAVFP